MSKTHRQTIPTKVKTNLWRLSGGRCQFENCNTPLWIHTATMAKMNKSYISHIYAVSENGARYDSELSPKLAKDISGLMLVCDECHRTFDDKSKVDEYPAERLISMKKAHEERIEILTGIAPDMRSHVLFYGARIGQHNTSLQFSMATEAILPNYYPSNPRPISINLNGTIEDHNDNYWTIEEENLVDSFKKKVEYLKGNDDVQHFSVFGLAPQPLLIKLGTLLNDLYNVEIYQLHREPTTWKWLDHDLDIGYQVLPSRGSELRNVALKIELSGTISDKRIEKVLGKNCNIWSITNDCPNNDCIKSRQHLKGFRENVRKTFDQLKLQHGEDAVIHVFPAMPVSAAVEFGRVWMPKADLPMILYDQNMKKGGFFKTIKIGN